MFFFKDYGMTCRPYYAIEMGIEYLSDTIPSNNQETFQLLKESVERTTSAKFFRYAFSFAKTSSLSPNELYKIFSNFLTYQKINLGGEINLEEDSLTQKAIACLLSYWQTPPVGDIFNPRYE